MNIFQKLIIKYVVSWYLNNKFIKEVIIKYYIYKNREYVETIIFILII